MTAPIKFPLIITLLTLLSISTTISARPGLPFHPCNTLIISSFSFSLPNPNNPNNPTNPINPNRIIFTNIPLFPRPRHQMTELPFRSYRPLLIPRPQFPDLPRTEMTDLPLGFSSVRDRTKDILSVVASLLFGAACGALTAGTMYLVWSLFNYRYESFDRLAGFVSDDEDDDDDDDLFNPKKSHYVAIPAAAVVVDGKVDKAAVTVAKEAV